MKEHKNYYSIQLQIVYQCRHVILENVMAHLGISPLRG